MCPLLMLTITLGCLFLIMNIHSIHIQATTVSDTTIIIFLSVRVTFHLINDLLSDLSTLLPIIFCVLLSLRFNLCFHISSILLLPKFYINDCHVVPSVSYIYNLWVRVTPKLLNTEQSSKGKCKAHKTTNRQNSVNNRKTEKTAMAPTWYRHFHA